MRPVAAFLFLTSLGSASDYTTYIGDSNRYRISAIVTDAPGNTYVTGNRILDLPGSPSDLFVTKLDPSGNIVFTSTLAGKGSDQAKAIALDPAGIYLGDERADSPRKERRGSGRQVRGVGVARNVCVPGHVNGDRDATSDPGAKKASAAGPARNNGAGKRSRVDDLIAGRRDLGNEGSNSFSGV